LRRASVTQIPKAIAVAFLLAFGSFAWTASASASSPPSIESESVSNVTPTDATLEAQINPNRLYTAYEFQIDTTGNYTFPLRGCPLPLPGDPVCDPLGGSETLPSGLLEPSPTYLAAGSGDQFVSLDLASIGAMLQPATTYHYRVIASNGGQNVDGLDQTFTTPSTGAPSIESESVSNITPADATLEAQINPKGMETTYQFKLESGCGIEKPEPGHGICMVIAETLVPPAQIPPAYGVQTVSVDLNAAGVTLRPDTEYRYSVQASNSAGSTMQEPEQVFKQTFTTSSTEAASEHQERTSTAGLSPQPTQSPSSTSLSHHKKLKHRWHRHQFHRGRRGR